MRRFVATRPTELRGTWTHTHRVRMTSFISHLTRVYACSICPETEEAIQTRLWLDGVVVGW